MSTHTVVSGHPRRKSGFLLAAGMLLYAFAASANAGAQESLPDSGSSSEDELFADEVVDNTPISNAGTGVKAALTYDRVRIGGSFTGSAGLSWQWNNPWVDGFDPVKPDTTAVSTTVSSLVFFDARPDEDFRVHGSVKASWPFATEPDISIFELFSDFTWKDSLFFRFGKSTVKWGTGYFWSPADVLNIGAIDFTDPTAQREGPVNFRIHLPIFGTQNNVYAYALLKPEDEKALKPSDIALAGKAEVLVRHYELGLGGFYQYGKPERAVFTLAGPLLDLDVFGEASLAHGSQKTYYSSISGIPPYIVQAPARTAWLLSATAGFMYNNQNANIVMVGQYFYNGEGYADADRKSLVGSGLAILEDPASPSDAIKFLGGAIPGIAYNSGMHYAGLSFSKSELLTEDLGFSVLAIANLSDLSGLVKPALSWKLFDRMSLQADLTFVFGEKTTEYGVLFKGNPVVLGLSAKLGTGAF